MGFYKQKEALTLILKYLNTDIAVLTAFFSLLKINNREFTGNSLEFGLCVNFLYRRGAAFNLKFPKKISGNLFGLAGKILFEFTYMQVLPNNIHFHQILFPVF